MSRAWTTSALTVSPVGNECASATTRAAYRPLRARPCACADS
jgi:hypothetical protein